MAMAHIRCRKRQTTAGPANVGCCTRCCDLADVILERKIGCDRTLPSCLNCNKGRRICQGYGLRLAWPDKQDGRRKQKRYEVTDPDIITDYVTRKDGCLAFLNTVVNDLDGSKISIQNLVESELTNYMPKPISPFPINEQDSMLLSHCKAHKHFFFNSCVLNISR